MRCITFTSHNPQISCYAFTSFTPGEGCYTFTSFVPDKDKDKDEEEKDNIPDKIDLKPHGISALFALHVHATKLYAVARFFDGKTYICEFSAMPAAQLGGLATVSAMERKTELPEESGYSYDECNIIARANYGMESPLVVSTSKGMAKAKFIVYDTVLLEHKFTFYGPQHTRGFGYVDDNYFAKDEVTRRVPSCVIRRVVENSDTDCCCDTDCFNDWKTWLESKSTEWVFYEGFSHEHCRDEDTEDGNDSICNDKEGYCFRNDAGQEVYMNGINMFNGDTEELKDRSPRQYKPVGGNNGQSVSGLCRVYDNCFGGEVLCYRDPHFTGDVAAIIITKATKRCPERYVAEDAEEGTFSLPPNYVGPWGYGYHGEWHTSNARDPLAYLCDSKRIFTFSRDGSWSGYKIEDFSEVEDIPSGGVGSTVYGDVFFTIEEDTKVMQTLLS